jgi:deoxyuridine 5'-triphosphate nucleotidohydrolase
MKIRVKKESEDITIPTRGHTLDAGWDLYSSEECYIAPNSRRLVDVGVRLEIPKGYVGLIWPRSGLAVNEGIDVFAGVIDSGYRGVIKVCLYNSSSEAVEIKKDDRIAQILFQETPAFELEEINDLSDSERKEGGFGSTGK